MNEEERESSKNLRRLGPAFAFLKPYKWQVIIASVALIVTASATLSLGQGIRMVIDSGFASGEIPQPLGSRHPSITPFDAFSSADDYIIIAAGNDQLFLKLCETIDSPELVNDERFKTNVDRSENNGPLKIAIEENRNS